ncbi:hypothetical protein CPB86DRAFT_869117 [Serendipita vermifera]|nr:hypothetical protein CPB86DRAFT_869117 [Serendipita vermifera]
MASSRNPKGRKTFADNSSPTQGTRGNRGSPWRTSGGANYSNAARQNSQFPPLSGSQQRPEAGYDPKLLSSLANLVGSAVIITLKTGARHEGTVDSILEGDAAGVKLKDCRDLSNPVSRDSVVFPASNIQSWAPKVANGNDSFKTDTDISTNAGSNPPRERELQQWQPDGNAPAATSLANLQGDEATFGPAGGYSGQPWDQFEVNEQLFGITTKYEEEAYTTKIDRNAPGFKERERKAQQLANEIMGGTTNNPHVAEERIMNGTDAVNGGGEEERYSAVVRAPGAYVPPGARRNGIGAAATATAGGSPGNGTTAATNAAPVNGVSGPNPNSTAAAPTTQADDATAKPSAEGLVANFRDFVTNEKQRLAQRKQAMVKTEMDKRKADLVKFSKTFKLPRPIPEDLVPILAKDEEKQKLIRDKANADVLATQARADAPSATAAGTGTASTPAASQDPNPKANVKPTAQTDGTAKKPKTSMFIQAIPPFKGGKPRQAGAPPPGTAAATGNGASAQSTAASSNATTPAIEATPASPTTAQTNSKLNANATVFKPNANAPVFKPISPGATPPPKPKEAAKDTAAAAPNPFYGTRVPSKKTGSTHIKDDFNPFRHSKVVDASQVSSIWPYNGKRYAALHPAPAPVHPAPGLNIPNPLIPGPPLPQQSHEEGLDSQGHAQRPMPQPQQQPPQQPQQQPPQPQQSPYPSMIYYPQYPYSPAPHGQQAMMMPPGTPYMSPPYMHPVPFPHHIPPNAGTPMYGHPPPGMPGVPPTPHYMPHAPYGQTSPPPTGTPRGPGPMGPQQMAPPTYYHPSPQLTHAMPYPMMMPPQPGPQHFDPTAQGPPPTVAPQPTPMGH